MNQDNPIYQELVMITVGMSCKCSNGCLLSKTMTQITSIQTTCQPIHAPKVLACDITSTKRLAKF